MGSMEHNISALKGRARRPSVQINEKEVVNACNMQTLVTSKQVANKSNLGGSSMRLVNTKAATSNRPKQAAAAIEHMVVRGANQGRTITREVEVNNLEAEDLENSSLLKGEDLMEQ